MHGNHHKDPTQQCSRDGTQTYDRRLLLITAVFQAMAVQQDHSSARSWLRNGCRGRWWICRWSVPGQGPVLRGQAAAQPMGCAA
jgi:hypothetical protein